MENHLQCAFRFYLAGLIFFSCFPQGEFLSTTPPQARLRLAVLRELYLFRAWTSKY
ncbi:hypothetical protein HMPREF6745_0737 [Prevotella sp. oral taxon 472 str. F0295]|nr:hypothetical protein HMPREF6745_0737 [Prevotella sp. oral taxon 472 str. F0295]